MCAHHASLQTSAKIVITAVLRCAPNWPSDHTQEDTKITVGASVAITTVTALSNGACMYRHAHVTSGHYPRPFWRGQPTTGLAACMLSSVAMTIRTYIPLIREGWSDEGVQAWRAPGKPLRKCLFPFMAPSSEQEGATHACIDFDIDCCCCFTANPGLPVSRYILSGYSSWIRPIINCQTLHFDDQSWYTS